VGRITAKMTKSPAIDRKADRTVYVRRPASDFQSRRESDL